MTAGQRTKSNYVFLKPENIDGSFWCYLFLSLSCCNLDFIFIDLGRIWLSA